MISARNLFISWQVASSVKDEFLHLEAELVFCLLSRRHPEAGLLHHSDRGSQYTSRAYRLSLEQAGIVVSMSRTGNCWDNAARERFFGSVKEECVGNTIYASHE
ncbi:MAG TPA: DDE-type integrase/transposase/recombinase, partial [Ktedonobacteraceae bacterium]|nr:DDE-type integrase/transposase/recombinase [Ktedonobacteraceae bacterium]